MLQMNKLDGELSSRNRQGCRWSPGYRVALATIMTVPTRFSVIALLSGVLAAGLTVSARQGAAPLASLVLPAGFQVGVFAENVENAR